MNKQAAPATFKAVDGEEGVIEAMISVFDNIDLQGDKVRPGAFQKNLDEWRAGGDPIPVVVSHDHSDLMQHIGYADPSDVVEVPEGLKARYTLDMDNPIAKQAYRLMKRRTLKNHSYTYDIVDDEVTGGVHVLKELRLLEMGPTLMGANPKTDVLAVKSLMETADRGQKTPPWHVEERDGQFCVVADETSETVKCHDTREAANDHMAALYANVEDASKDTEHDEKAGRRISTATAARLRSLQQRMDEMRQEVDSILAEGENEVQDTGEGKALEPDANGSPGMDRLLAVKAEIAAREVR
jgi:HK97 family phage prohead protease